MIVVNKKHNNTDILDDYTKDALKLLSSKPEGFFLCNLRD